MTDTDLASWAELAAGVGLEPALESLPRPGRSAGGRFRLSTGALIEREGEWLFALSILGPAAAVPGRVVLFGLGGRPETGERLAQAVEREVREEAGLRARAVDAPETLVFNASSPPGSAAVPARRVRLADALAPRPAYIWCHGAGPAEWWEYGVDLGGYVCAVYLVRAASFPRLRVEADDGVHGWAWLTGAALRTAAATTPPRPGQPTTPGLLQVTAGAPGVRVATEGRPVAPGTPLVLVGSAVFAPAWLKEAGRS